MTFRSAIVIVIIMKCCCCWRILWVLWIRLKVNHILVQNNCVLFWVYYPFITKVSINFHRRFWWRNGKIILPSYRRSIWIRYFTIFPTIIKGSLFLLILAFRLDHVIALIIICISVIVQLGNIDYLIVFTTSQSYFWIDCIALAIQTILLLISNMIWIGLLHRLERIMSLPYFISEVMHVYVVYIYVVFSVVLAVWVVVGGEITHKNVFTVALI